MGKRRFIYGAFSLAACLCFSLSASCFVHTHRFEWGTVTHSHPFPRGGHTHSHSSCQLVSYLDLAAAEPAQEPAAADVPVRFVLIRCTPGPCETGCCTPCRLLRAPPAVLA